MGKSYVYINIYSGGTDGQLVIMTSGGGVVVYIIW